MLRGRTAVHAVAVAAAGKYEELLRAMEEWEVDTSNGKERMVLHVATDKGHVRCTDAQRCR